jgi:hypothetical protein
VEGGDNNLGETQEQRDTGLKVTHIESGKVVCSDGSQVVSREVDGADRHVLRREREGMTE